MTTRYVCINGHDEDAPGQRIWLSPSGVAVYGCSFALCQAEAEPVTEAERDEIKARRDAEYERMINLPIGKWEVGR